jgi:hypothetical protein
MRCASLFCLALLGSTPVFASDACSYVANEDVERVTGRKLLFQLTSMPLPDGAGTLCDSNIVRVIVLSGENSEQVWEKMIKDAGREAEEPSSVSSLGDHAYVLHLAPRNEREYPTALVVATSGTNTVAISVRAKEGQSAESAQPAAVELAKIVISKLE